MVLSTFTNVFRSFPLLRHHPPAVTAGISPASRSRCLGRRSDGKAQPQDGSPPWPPWATWAANRSDTSGRHHVELGPAWCSGVGMSSLQAHQTRLIQRSHARTATRDSSATTVCSDSGADRKTCDSARGVSVRLGSAVGRKYEEVFGESDGECTVFGRETTPKLPPRRGVRHQDGL